MSELIDQYIGNYRITGLLSREGVVETYLAVHRHLNTQAVVKVLSVQLAAEQEQLFQRKEQPVAELTHKHIARLLDFEVLQGRPVLFQDYFPAGTLRVVHPQGARTVLRQVLSYTRRLADALQFIHARQMVHGDLRPENVMLSWESNILLNNCGLIELVRALGLENGYQPAGAFAYFAPERFQGQLLPASDQYALAVMIYEWLCGAPPFQGPFSEQVSAHLSSPPPPLQTRGVNIPPDIEQSLMIALAKDPARRFASIQAFANAFEQACKSAGIVPTGMASLAVTMPAPVSVASTVWGAPASPSMPAPGAVAANGSAVPVQQKPLSRRALFALFTLGGVGLIAASSAGTYAVLNLSGNAGAAPLAQQPGTTPVGKLVVTCSNTGQVEYISWSLDGNRLASGSIGPDQLQVWDAASAKQVSITTKNVSLLGISLDNPYAWVGERLYQALIDTTDQQNPLIRVRDLVGNKDILVYQGYVSERSTSTQVITPQRVAWSPNSQLLASLAYETGIRVWNAQSGADISTFRVQVGDHGITSEYTLEVDSMAWAPDSRQMASWGSTGIIYVWDTSNGKLVCSYSKHWDQHKNDLSSPNIDPTVVWSPDSTRIVSSVATDDTLHSNDGVIHVWDASSGQDICTFNHSQPNSGTSDMNWSADSQLLVCVMQGNAVVWNASTGAIVTTRYTRGGDNVAWHPHRRYIASTMQSTTDTDDGYKGYIWDAMTGKEILRLNSYTEDTLAWSPDGLRLALNTLNNTVEIWQIWE